MVHSCVGQNLAHYSIPAEGLVSIGYGFILEAYPQIGVWCVIAAVLRKMPLANTASLPEYHQKKGREGLP